MKKIQLMCTSIYVFATLTMVTALSSTKDILFYVECMFILISAMICYIVCGKALQFLKDFSVSQARTQVELKECTSIMYQEMCDMVKGVSQLQEDMLEGNNVVLKEIRTSIEKMETQTSMLCNSIDERLDRHLQIATSEKKELDHTVLEFMNKFMQLSNKNTEEIKNMAHGITSCIQKIEYSLTQQQEFVDKNLVDMSKMLTEKVTSVSTKLEEANTQVAKDIVVGYESAIKNIEIKLQEQEATLEERLNELTEYLGNIIEDLADKNAELVDGFADKSEESLSHVAKEIKQKMQQCLDAYETLNIDFNKNNVKYISEAYVQLVKSQKELVKSVERQQLKYQQLNEEEVNLIRDVLSI